MMMQVFGAAVLAASAVVMAGTANADPTSPPSPYQTRFRSRCAGIATRSPGPVTLFGPPRPLLGAARFRFRTVNRGAATTTRGGP